MSPEERLRLLRDDARWADQPFEPRAARPRPRVAVAGFALAAVVVAALVVVGLQRSPERGTPSARQLPAISEAAVVPWLARAPAGEAPSAVSGAEDVLPVTVAVAAPAEVGAGTVLRYTVTLTNRTTRTVPLTPCPAFRESVTAAHQVLGTFRYSLNCGPAGSLAPRGSVAFAMRIPIPATASGPVALRWALERGPGATAAVTVGR